MSNTVGSHICFSVAKDCYNLYDSYGQICVHCNCCGRIDQKTKLQQRLKLNERMLEEQLAFDKWDESIRELQEKNRAANIAYFKRRIYNLKRQIKRQEASK